MTFSPSSLTGSYTLLSQLSQAYVHSSFSTAGVATCPCSSPAEKFCDNCASPLCTSCLLSHASLPFTRGHSVHSVRDRPAKCDTHQEVIKLFCTSCSLPLCPTCALLFHLKECEEEKVIPIAKAVESARGKFVEELGSPLERKIQRLRVEKSHCKDRIADLEARILQLQRNHEEEERVLTSLCVEEERESVSLDALSRLSEAPSPLDILDPRKYSDLLSLALSSIPLLKESLQLADDEIEAERQRERERVLDAKKIDMENEKKAKERQQQEEDERERAKEEGREKEKERGDEKHAKEKGSKTERKRPRLEEELRRGNGERRSQSFYGRGREREGDKDKEGEVRTKEKEKERKRNEKAMKSVYVWDLSHSLPACTLSDNGKAISSPPSPSNGALFSANELTPGTFSRFLSLSLLVYSLCESHSPSPDFIILSSRSASRVDVHNRQCIRSQLHVIWCWTARTQCHSVGMRRCVCAPDKEMSASQ
jgi:hypothetical protein